jgi:hypothetical protein
MLLFMHHITLYTPCIALFNCGHLLHIRVDHAEPESEFEAEQVQGMFGGPQASSCEDTNIFVIKTSLMHPTLSLSFVYLYILFMILECALGYRS